MTREHLFLIVAFLGAIGVQLAGAKEWHETLTTAFVGGLLVQIAAFTRALFLDKVGK